MQTAIQACSLATERGLILLHQSVHPKVPNQALPAFWVGSRRLESAQSAAELIASVFYSPNSLGRHEGKTNGQLLGSP